MALRIFMNEERCNSRKNPTYSTNDTTVGGNGIEGFYKNPEIKEKTKIQRVCCRARGIWKG